MKNSKRQNDPHFLQFFILFRQPRATAHLAELGQWKSNLQLCLAMTVLSRRFDLITVSCLYVCLGVIVAVIAADAAKESILWFH